MCVYLDVTHLPRELLDRKLAGILEIYEKFQGADPRNAPMKIFPAVHYTMGGLWCDYEANARRRAEHRLAAEPADQHPGPVRHRRVRVPVPRRQPPGRQLAGGLHLQRPDGGPGHRQLRGQFHRPEVRRAAVRRCSTRPRRKHQEYYDALLKRPQGGPNPYKVHAELGQLMTKSATVVRHNDDMQETYAKVCELQQQAARCSLSDTGAWANQTAPFARALEDMFPVAKAILQGAIARDECRGAHYKPEFAMPEITATEPAQRRREAEAWCDRFEANNRKWLKSTIATCRAGGEPQLSYEDVDTGPDPAPAAALRPRRRRRDRAGVEAAASRKEIMKSEIRISKS